MAAPEDSIAAQLASWPVDEVECAVISPDGVLAAFSDSSLPYAWASVTKLVTALAVLDAARDGIISLDDPLGPPGSSVAHLLAHASGLAMDGFSALAAPGHRRIYSNSGYELLADHVAARWPKGFGDRLASTVLLPLGMDSTSLRGGAGHGVVGTLDDLARLGRELLRPTAIDPGLVAQLTTPAFPGLAGVVPGFGRHEDCAWGMGAEIRDHKEPHWTSMLNSPATFGHFGQSGCFLWVDPAAGLACAVVTRTPFGPWAAQAWPRLSDSVMAAYT